MPWLLIIDCDGIMHDSDERNEKSSFGVELFCLTIVQCLGREHQLVRSHW